jgi:hypothetical protein
MLERPEARASDGHESSWDGHGCGSSPLQVAQQPGGEAHECEERVTDSVMYAERRVVAWSGGNVATTKLGGSAHGGLALERSEHERGRTGRQMKVESE